MSFLFVTAQKADHKAINRFLTYAHDWECDDGNFFEGNSFTLMRTRDLAAAKQAGRTYVPDLPPIDPAFNSPWRGSDMPSVEHFAKQLYHLSPSSGINLFVVLDDAGLDNETCVIFERVFDDEEDDVESASLDEDDEGEETGVKAHSGQHEQEDAEGDHGVEGRDEDAPESTDALDKQDEEDRIPFEKIRYQKLRLPWEEVDSCWANLWISNMDFEEFCMEEEPTADGVHGYNTSASTELDPEALERRTSTLARFERDGLV